jgi:hypothetical protein
LWSLGVRPSIATVDLRFQHDKVTHAQYELNTLSVAHEIGARVEIVASVQLEQEEEITSGENPHYYVGYGVRPSRLAPEAKQFGLGASVTPNSSSDERRDAFDFDLSCISSFRGCRAPCQILLAVWQEVERRSSSKEIALPEEVLEDSSCRGSARSGH